MTLVVDVPRPAAQIEADLAGVAARLDLLVSVRETAPDHDEGVASSPYVLRVHGADRPGLLHRVTALLASYGANVTDLTTRLIGAAGAPVYVIVVAADVPADADADALAADVGALARELEVEATLRPVDDDLL
jgi:glycine cleavage system transcriptional repressor